jgi:ornithine decarboxylase
MKPYFEISKKVVLDNYNKLLSFADVISYSTKTNQIITKILEKNTDCFFSVHFTNELKHIEDMSRVIFLAQGWNNEEIKSLLALGISRFIVDNEFDLDIVIKYLEQSNVKNKIGLMLRLKLKERTVKTEKCFVFGMKSKVINDRVRQIRTNKLLDGKINMLGVHFHRKTQNMAEWNLKYELSNILEEDVLKMLDILNIGGGIPSKYANVNLNVIPGIINKINDFKDYLHENNIKLMVEPGRFIAGSAGKLITEVIGIHENNIIVNASVYNTNLDALIVPVKLCVKDEYSKEEAQNNKDIKSYTIKGSTPCSFDLFRYRVYLKEVNVGDELIFVNAGAYNFTTDFCDLEKLETKIVEDFGNE